MLSLSAALLCFFRVQLSNLSVALFGHRVVAKRLNVRRQRDSAETLTLSPNRPG